MTSSTDRVQLAYRLIGDVLRRHWDPLNVSDQPETSDEYESYVGGVYQLLVKGASPRDIAEHLVHVETTALGFVDTEPKTLIPLANKLLKIRRRLALGGAA